MKRYKYYLLSLVAVFGLTACDSLLDEDPKYTQNSSVVFSTEDNAELALLGCYSYLTANYGYGQMWQEVPIEASGLSFIIRNGGDDCLLGMLAATPANSMVSYAWDGMYKAIVEANAFILSMEESGLSDDVKVQKIGEAKIIRALGYYNLVSLFGPVPLRVTASSSDGIALGRSSEEEVFAQIIQDLTDAMSISETSDNGRFNSWTAKAFLGKVYYKMAMLGIDATTNLNNAKTYFDDVYNNGPYTLESNFDDLFGDFVNSDENIIQLNFTATLATDCYNRASNRFAPQASTTGVSWGQKRVAKYIYDLHNGTYPGDPRLKTTYLTQWRTRSGNNQASPKAQVGSELTPNDSTYTYPYWAVNGNLGTDIVPGTTSTKLQIVFCLPYDEMEDPTNPSIEFLNSYTNPNSKYGSHATQYANQVKQTVTKFTQVGNSNKWPYYGKLYDQNQSAQMSHKNLPVFRYAEMLLLMADVYNELGNTTQAISLANEVLTRARQSGSGTEPANWSTSLSASEVTKKLYYERIFELLGEPDIYDMVRIRGIEYMRELLEYNNNHELVILSNSYYASTANQWVDYLFNDGNLTDEFLTKNLLLPIPNSEIDANPGLTDQNYGY
ncbi:MAG: RagB/SusD family nutrient uptake outer membrane protein [Bacteroides sp.]|nr:RagB/SusD family nutrient uptake outer membrane protein [Bacteroides sp.]